jgi:site-specific recombinase XerD
MFSKAEMNERSERLKKYIKHKDKEEYKELLAAGKISSFNEFYEYKERQENPNFNKEKDLERLNQLLDEGYLTQEEYEKLK